MVRFKNRYVTVEIISPTVPDNRPLHLKSKIFHDTVMDKIQHLHGDFGVAAVKTGFLTKYCNENTRIAILKSRHGPHRFVTSALPFITKIGKLEANLRTLHVGATLKHSFKYIQKHQRSYLDTMWSKLKTDEERKALENAVMDFTKTDVSINIENIGSFVRCAGLKTIFTWNDMLNFYAGLNAFQSMTMPSNTIEKLNDKKPINQNGNNLMSHKQK